MTYLAPQFEIDIHSNFN